MTGPVAVALAAVVITLLGQTAALAFWGGRISKAVQELERWRIATEKRLTQLDRRSYNDGAP